MLIFRIHNKLVSQKTTNISRLKGNSKSLPLLHAQVKRWEEQNRPDPCCENMARYVAVLKVSHEAAVQGNEGLLHMATEDQRVD